MTTKSPYPKIVKHYQAHGPVTLGIHTSHFWKSDPKHLGIMLARYKFVSKMLAGYGDVLEVGCGDGFGAAVVLQEVGRIHAVDADATVIEHARRERTSDRLTFSCVDLSQTTVSPRSDAAYLIDVLEHVPVHEETRFMTNVVRSLRPQGVCIIGIPSIESQRYASAYSRKEHVNCKNGPELKAFAKKYFRHIFLFSMNDEVVHTGFTPMAHYLWVLCIQPLQAKTKRRGR